ncbi:MAG: MBOAT family O-acyltransferase [Vicinamibacterales bacterium]
MTVTGATDPTFLGWLIATVIVAWIVPARVRPDAAAVMTATFLGLADPRSLVVLAALTLIVIVATRRGGRPGSRWMPGAMGLVVVVLFAFKALDPVRGLLDGGLVIPLGLSFYTLRCLHVLIECHLGELQPPAPRLLLAYLFFLPTIVAGPVHRLPAFAAERPQLDWPRFSAALERILYGYAMIVVISNYLLSDKLFPAMKPRFAPASAAYQYLDCLDFGLNLYFQFAGYSSIAIGFALLLGHRVMENFDRPLLRTNLAAFWRAWHVSVTGWCRDYVFSAVFATTRRRWAGLVATMLAVGVWHGLSLNFVAWGLYHGVGLVVSQAWTGRILGQRTRGGTAAAALAVGGWLVTFNFVMIGFAWTKEPDLASALAVFRIFLAGGP